MSNALVRVAGWRATLLHGDPAVYDRWRWLDRHMERGPVRTLDAGCGSGAFTLFAARLGNQAIGLSFDEANNTKATERARILGFDNARFRIADLREIDRHLESLGLFDQVLCLETIEHIENDRKLLANLARLIKPGGRLLLTTPYKYYHRLIGDKLSAQEDGGHVRWGYTHEEMRTLFAEAGLDLEDASYVSGIVTQHLTNLMRLLARVDVRLAWAFTLPLRVLQILDKPLTRLSRYPPLSIAVIGAKPMSDDVRDVDVLARVGARDRA